MLHQHDPEDSHRLPKYTSIACGIRIVHPGEPGIRGSLPSALGRSSYCKQTGEGGTEGREGQREGGREGERGGERERFSIFSYTY